MEESAVLGSEAVKVLLRGLQSTVNMDTLNTGFHSEKLAFLEVAHVLQLFCTTITLSRNTYGNSKIDDNKIVVNSLGMGVGETWRGVPDARLRGNALESDIPVLSDQMVLQQCVRES